MAKTKIGGITVEIGADTSNLSKKLKDVNTESKKTTSELKSIDAALKQAPNSVELWRQKQEALARAVENSKKKLEALNSEQENLQKGLQDGTITEEAYKAYQREVEITKGQIEAAEKALDDFTNSNSKAGDSAKQTGKDIEDSGKKAENSAEGFTVLKGAVAKLAADGFEKLMSSAKEAWEEIDEGYDTIITKTGATGEKLEGLQRTADNIFKSMPVEMSDVGSAVGEVNTRFELTDAELQATTEHFLKYAEINKTQVAGSVRNVSGIMKAFQEDTKNTGRVLDTLTDVGQRTGKDLSSLESELLSNSATFKELGLDIRQSAELLGQFEANGVETSTALKGLQKAQQEATAEGKTTAEALGETVDRIKGAKDETEALQIATDLFGKKGAATLTQAIREQRFSIDDLVAGYDDMRNVVSDTFEATQDAPDKAKVALNNLKLELAQLGEAVLPKIEKLVSKGVDNLPKIEKTMKDLLPLVKGVAVAYASWKVVSTASDGVKALQKFTVEMKTTEAGAKSLSAALDTGVLAIVSLIAAGLIDLGKEIKKAHDEFIPVAERINRSVTDAFNDQNEAIKNVAESLNDTNEAFQDSADTADYEADRARDLWAELDKLTDASGRVQTADKKRAEYIANQLKEAVNTEITFTGNQIENYQQLAREIDNVIEKKRASAYIDAFQASAGDMAKNRETVRSEYLSAYAQEQAALEEFNKLSLERYGRHMTPEEFQDLMTQTYDRTDVWNTIDARMAELAGTAQTAGANRQELQAQYNELTDYFNRLDAAEKAQAEGRYKEIESILYAQKDANREALKSVKDWNEDAEKIYEENIKKVQASFKLARETNAKLAQSDINEILSLFTETAEAGMGAGNKKAAEVISQEFKEEFQKMIDDGFDISELAKWAKDSGIDIADVFGDEYTDYIQKQLDQGYDVHDLLQWAFDTGGRMSTEQWNNYITLWKENIRSSFGEESSIDIAGMVAWAERTGRTLGDITGDNFSRAFSEWTRDLYENNDLINEHSINSEWDAYLQGKGSRAYAPAHAAGGFEYGSGIVAEAGPELLEVVNGGVRITPLTPSAKNTPVGAGSGTTINNYNNTVYATVRDKYDVYGMAEDMATAERRIEQGKGR